MFSKYLNLALITAISAHEASKINAPASKNDSIAIVGAGVGGIYTAYRLKQLGYQDVTVFEKSNKVGGKMQSHWNSGHWTDIGTVYFVPGYDWVYKLCKDLNIPMYKYNLYGYYTALYNRIFYNFPEYDFTSIDDTVYENKYDWIQNNLDYLNGIADRYEEMHSKAMSKSNPRVYQFPDLVDHEQMKLLGNTTFLEWVDGNGFNQMMPFLDYIMSFLFYAPTHTISAYYGLYWCTPIMLRSMITGATIQDRYKPAIGFNGLVEKMVVDQDIKVIYNAKIKKVIRRNKRSVGISFSTPAMSKRQTLEFDFLVSAIHPKYYESGRKSGSGKTVVFKMTEQEQNLLGDENWTTNRVSFTVVTANNQNKNYFHAAYPIEVYRQDQLQAKNMYPKWHGAVCVSRKYGIAAKQAPLYWNSMLDEYTGKVDMTSVYANYWNFDQKMSNDFVCYSTKFNVDIKTNGVARHIKFNPELTKDVVQFTKGDVNVQETDVIEQYEREYFNRWTNENVALGKPVDLFNYNLNKSENDRNTWFVGAYASYESVGRVVDYIELLLERSGLKERHQGVVCDIDSELIDDHEFEVPEETWDMPSYMMNGMK